MGELAEEVDERLGKLAANPRASDKIVRALGAIPVHLKVDDEEAWLGVVEKRLARLDGRPQIGRPVSIETRRVNLLALANGEVTVKDALQDGRLVVVADARVLPDVQRALEVYVATVPPRESAPFATLQVAPAMHPDAERVLKVRAPRVTIFGAGITGLTAAHELVERGFYVQVVERLAHPDQNVGCQVGGIARTVYHRLPMPGGPDEPRETPKDQEYNPSRRGGGRPDASGMIRAEKPRNVRDHLDFAAGAEKADDRLLDRWGRTNEDRFARIVARLEAFAAELADGAEGSLPVEVRAHYRGAEGAELAHLRAKHVVERLRAAGVPESIALLPRAVEHTRPWVYPADKKIGLCAWEDRVDFRVVERRAPGEHGYRFFPSCYRNLFDTMRRTPVFDARGEETGRTAFDNLVPTGTMAVITPDGGEPIAVPRRRSPSLEAVRDLLARFQDQLHFTQRDLALFQIRLFTYLTSCSARRAGVYEKSSWRDWIRVDDFSEGFRDFLLDAPQTNVAMNADVIDARTHGNFTVQLLLDQATSGETVDMTLNGPTTPAWLSPWKDYLKRQGVQFFRGNLDAIVPDGEGGLVPRFGAPPHDREVGASTPPGPIPDPRRVPGYPVDQDTEGTGEALHVFDAPAAGDGAKRPKPPPDIGVEPLPEGNVRYARESDYYLLALPLEAVWDVTSGLDDVKLDGDLAKLRTWRIEIEAETDQPFERWRHDMPRDKAGVGVGPFRDFGGVQFFFPNGQRFGLEGHVYFPQTRWGLSAISQAPYWRVRRVLANHGYLAGMSVDLGQWYGLGEKVYKPAIRCSPGEIAGEVWAQIATRFHPDLAAVLAPPLWYSVDPYLHFGPRGVARNAAPFLINRPEDCPRRPGTVLPPRPWVKRPGESPPTLPGVPPAEQRIARLLTSGIFYGISAGRWMVAGPHMKTHTRMNTMEAANESARHAVNTILVHLASQERPPLPKKDAPAVPPAGTLMGDFCRVWDPEENEIEDLAPLKRLDERLYEKKLPHMAEILQLERLADLVESRYEPEHVQTILDEIAGAVEGEVRRQGGQGVHFLMKELDRIRERVMGKAGR